MNKNIKLAVAGAVLALSASAANAGIVIPAGEWTLDVNGNVNAFVNYTHAKASGGTVTGGLASTPTTGPNGDKYIGINTGLLPSWLGFTGTTRQNDVDVSFTISMQPNVSDNSVAGDGKTPLFRQSFLTFGDKSWGSIKLGKDIGIFASNAILNDMTLLGVGGGAANSGAPTTLGGIGTGYIYAGWKGQATYTTPNFNGFSASVGIVNPNMSISSVLANANQDRFGFEGQASYAFSADQFSGKVWVGGLSHDVNISDAANKSFTATAGEIGATINANGMGLTAYWYDGQGIGTTMLHGYPSWNSTASTTSTAKRSSDGGYIQATYALPTKTKIGLAYGVSNLGMTTGDATTLVRSNERITLGAYHPLTKHLNLVAEYNNIQSENQAGQKNESDTYSAGAILFF